MKRKEFLEERQDILKERQDIPNKRQNMKKQDTSLVRISKEALHTLKLNSVHARLSMKEYLENLIFADNEKRDKGE